VARIESEARERESKAKQRKQEIPQVNPSPGSSFPHGLVPQLIPLEQLPNSVRDWVNATDVRYAMVTLTTMTIKSAAFDKAVSRILLDRKTILLNIRASANQLM
jgi:hypothetical protein